MKIAFNPSTVAALITPPNNKDITFDLRGRNIFARGVKFCGTDTNTWRDIKINNVSIGSNTLDLRNGNNTTLTNTNGVVTINSTWRPVVDNLTSDSTTSSLSAKQGKVLKSLIDGKSDSGHTHDDRYLKLTGGTMASNALITFADSGSWGTDKGPQGARGGLYWTGQSDYAKLYAEETVGDNLDLVIQFGDDNSNGLSIRNKANTQTSYISAGGVITTGTFKGNLDWSYITNKPSSYTPSAHTHAWNSLTHSSTTENQAILTNGKANGWKLYTLNISRWDNAANNAHSHANKSVLDGITSALVNNWNIAYTFVNTITGTDTDKVINKWDEIVNFLAGITEDNKLNTLLNSKLSVYELANNTNVGAIKNNGIYYSTSDASSGTLTNSPFNTGFALINMTSLDNGDDLRRSRLAFNAYGEVKISNDRDLANTAETWYNVLTSKNSGISGSTIKLNGTSITVYSSSTADGRYVKKSGDTMTGALNFKNGTWNLVGDDSYMGDCNVSGHFGIKAANTTYPGIAFFNNSGAHLGNLTAYNGNIKYGAYSLRFLDNGNTSVGASTWTNPFSGYNSNAVADGQAICVWGQSSSLSNLAADSGDMSLWLKRVNAKAATLNMVLDGEYYANGNLRLAHVSEIPSSLKNPHALTISLNGTSQGPYDGSAAKNINITPGSIGAATSNHTHDYLRGHRLGYRHLDAGPKSSWSDSRLYIGYNGFSDDNGVTDSIGFYRSTGTGTYTRTLWAEINSNGLYANTRFGVNGQNTGYHFYVNGTSLLNNTVRIQCNTPNLFIRNTVDTSYSIIRLGTNSNENASYIFQNGPSRTDDGGANTMTIRNNVGNLRLDNATIITGSQTLYSLTSTCNAGNDASYTKAAVQIREYNFGGSQSETWAIAPRLAWHWSGRAQAQIGLGNNNHLYISENNFSNAYRIVMETGTWGISINGNAATATRADTVDGYHASSLWRSDGATWNPNANVSLNASANSQEWSFDIRRNGYTGCYWHVWDSSLGTMLKVNADNGKVYAPYNFVGNLEGNASTATALTTNAGNSINPIYFSGGKPVACTMSTGRGNGIVRSFSRGTYTSANQYFGNGTIVTIDPKGTGCISANDTILSLGDLSIRNTQLLVAYDRDGVYYRRITDGLSYGDWKRLAFTTDNVASATKLQTARTIWGQSFDGTRDVNGTIYINNGDSSNGAIRLNNNVNSNARISAISDKVIFNTGNAIRFGETAWDWNQWAGLKYTHSNKTIYLGIADNSIFNANSALNGGSLRFPGISNVYATTFNGSLSGNASTATNADKVDGYHANTVYNAPSFRVNNSNTSNTYILLATITISGTSLSCSEFTILFQNRECLDNSSFILSGAIRRNSTTNVGATLSYITLHTEIPRNIYLRSNDGVTFMVYILSAASAWTTYYRAIPIVDSGNIIYSNTGTTSPISGSVLNITATKGGNVNYANSAGNADTLDSYHANGLLTALSNSNNGVSITVGGTTKSVSNISVNYASSAGSATKVIVNLHTANDTNYPLVWSNLANSSTITENQLYKSWSDLYYNPKNKRLTVGGSVVASSFVKRGGTSLQLLRADGGIAAFNWSGQSGLPTWLWGGNNEHSYYVYNPSNFRVAYATSAGSADTALYLRSLGNLNCQTGRTLNYGDVYTYNTYANNTGAPTSYTSVIGFGRGIAGTVEIAGGWDNTNLYWRSLRDCCEDWHSWRTVLDSSNYTEFINNYYWANVKISTSSSTTTSPTVSNLTATSSIRMGNIYLLNTNEINSTSGIHLNYQNSGNISLCYGGGKVGIGTTSPTYKLDVNGLIRASGFHHSSMNSDNYILLAGGGYKSFGGDSSHPVFLGYLNLDHGSDGTVSSSFSCLGYTVPFTYTRGGNYCKISIPDTTHQAFYIKAATASVNYSGGGMDTWTGNHRGAGAWWLHCYAPSSNEVRVKGFHLKDTNNDSWWGGNPLWSDRSGVNRITVCIFGYVTFR